MWWSLLGLQPVVQWILPTGSKSKILSTEMKKGPAIVLFTPNHPLSGINFHFSQVCALEFSILQLNIDFLLHSFVTSLWPIGIAKMVLILRTSSSGLLICAGRLCWTRLKFQSCVRTNRPVWSNPRCRNSQQLKAAACRYPQQRTTHAAPASITTQPTHRAASLVQYSVISATPCCVISRQARPALSRCWTTTLVNTSLSAVMRLRAIQCQTFAIPTWRVHQNSVTNIAYGVKTDGGTPLWCTCSMRSHSLRITTVAQLTQPSTSMQWTLVAVNRLLNDLVCIRSEQITERRLLLLIFMWGFYFILSWFNDG